MHKIDEIHWNEHFIDDIEITLFEPECIITDSTKDEILFTFGDNSKESTVQEIYLDAVKDLNFTSTNDIKDCVTIKPINNKSNFRQNNSNNGTIFHNNVSVADALLDATNQAYLENVEMHSIFTPDKRSKPKEIFTQCHFCGKYVIIRMCPETGVYSKCKHCLNTPVSFNHTNIYENVNNFPLVIKPEISIKSDSEFFKNFLPPETANHSKSDGAFKCDHCGKLFTRNWYLKQHIKLHLNEKPFACSHCEKRFLNSSNLKQHMRTHSVEYRCCICNKTYISQMALKEHTVKHKGTMTTLKNSLIQISPEDLSIRKFQCSFCKQKFIEENRLKEHLQNHTKEILLHCDKCDKSFKYNNTFIKHKKVHDIDSAFSFKL